jgi:hypothetical protein
MKEKLKKSNKNNALCVASLVFEGFKCHPYYALKTAIVGGESPWGQHKFIAQGSCVDLGQASMSRL